MKSYETFHKLHRIEKGVNKNDWETKAASLQRMILQYPNNIYQLNSPYMYTYLLFWNETDVFIEKGRNYNFLKDSEG